MTRSASHPILCLRPITGHGCARLAREFGSASDLEDCIGRDLLPTRCAHVICPHRRGEVVERSPAGTNVRLGSWLCENAKTLNRDRRSYSSKTVLVAQRASGFNLEIELKNIILRRVSIFEFLHSQGQTRKSPLSFDRRARRLG